MINCAVFWKSYTYFNATYLTGGEDYDTGPSTHMKIIFPAGTPFVEFHVAVIDDNIFEQTETFQVTILPVSLPYGVILGNITTTMVDIVDEESKYFFHKFMYVLCTHTSNVPYW